MNEMDDNMKQQRPTYATGSDRQHCGDQNIYKANVRARLLTTDPFVVDAANSALKIVYDLFPNERLYILLVIHLGSSSLAARRR